MRLILALAVALCGSISAAQARPDSLRMSCGQTSALVQSHGGVVIGTGADIYDRFVTGCSFCPDMSFLQPRGFKPATIRNAMSAIAASTTRFSIPQCRAASPATAAPESGEVELESPAAHPRLRA